MSIIRSSVYETLCKLTLVIEHCIDKCIVPLNYHHYLYCVAQQLHEIFVKYLVAFFVLPIDHMIQLIIEIKLEFH